MTIRTLLCLALLALFATAASAEARGPPAFVASLPAADHGPAWGNAKGHANGMGMLAAADEPASTEDVTPTPSPADVSDTPLPTDLPQNPDLPVDLADDPAPKAPDLPSLPEVPAPAPAPAPRVPDAADVAATWAPVGLLAIAVAAGIAPAVAGRGPFRRDPRQATPRPTHEVPPVRRALALIQEGHPTEAAQTARRALRHRPADPEARYLLGVALARDGHVRQALQELDYAIRLNDIFLGLMVQDPALEGFVARQEVHRFIRRHARAFHDRVHRAYV